MSDSVPRQTVILQKDDAPQIATRLSFVTLAKIIEEAVEQRRIRESKEITEDISIQPKTEAGWRAWYAFLESFGKRGTPPAHQTFGWKNQKVPMRNISSNHPNQNIGASQLVNGFDNRAVIRTSFTEQISSVPSNPGAEQPVPAVLSSEPASNNADESLLPNVPMALPNSLSRRLSSPNSENNPKQSVPPTPEEMQQPQQEEPKRLQTNRTSSWGSLNLSDLFHEDSEKESRMEKLGKWTRCKSAFNGFLKQITSCFRRQKAIEELLQ